MAVEFSIIVPCHNEATTIARKLDNCLELGGGGQVEILVVDDYSTDATVAQVNEYLGARGRRPDTTRVTLLANRWSPGKNGALLTALAAATGRIHLITDADVLLDADALERARAHFDADPELGGLCLTPRITSGSRATAVAYIRGYERFNRRVKILQSRLDSLPILHGQAMFIRASANVTPHPALPADDVDLAFQVRLGGRRVRYAQDVGFYEVLSPDRGHVFRQKVRRAKAVMRSLWHYRGVLFNPRYRLFGAICVPIDFFLYFLLAPLALMAGLGAATFLVGRFGATAAGVILVTCALIAATPLRQVVLYLTILLLAQVTLLLERRPRVRWKTPRLGSDAATVPARRAE